MKDVFQVFIHIERGKHRMFLPVFTNRTSRRILAEASGKLAALEKSQAIIEFDLNGIILTANANFLDAVGYKLEDVVGKHHEMFVDPDFARSAAYKAFWSHLREGNFEKGEYKRVGKGGREIWLEASYNPILDETGRPIKVIKFASDVTLQKHRASDFEGQIQAISKSQAVIEFNLDGTIINANENFLATMGYRLEEIAGRHHSMFVETDFARSAEYAQFWAGLRRGEFQAAEFVRVGKGGRRVVIQASYNPILDVSGKPVKVVKFATDVTARKTAVETLSDSLAKLAKGDLDARIDVRFGLDFEAVRGALNQTVDRFVSIIGQLRHTSGALKLATTEILSGANDLSERTTRQAAAIEETSATMEQLSGIVADSARKAVAASDQANNVSRTAEEGGVVMHQANEAMERITHSSSKISNIIGMIDDIAFQTNLLALNASVEAARAGDAGKGFAVVAVEVRRLAQSAASASSEVKALIEQSAAEVSGGTKLVAEAAEKLASMLAAVKENSVALEGIAMASREQASSIEEVNSAVRTMDEMTQHNAALVEEINASIEQTEAQASELDRVVDVFRLAEPSSMRPLRQVA